MMWFDKDDDRCLFADCRNESLDVSHCTTNPGKKSVEPDQGIQLTNNKINKLQNQKWK